MQPSVCSIADVVRRRIAAVVAQRSAAEIQIQLEEKLKQFLLPEAS